MPASWARAPGRGQEGRRAVPAGIPEVSWGAGQAGAAGSFRLLSHPRLPPASPGPLVLPASSPDPLTPRLGPTLLQGNPRSLADLVGEGSGLGVIHMESGSEPRTRASPPSAWPRASASLSWATATLPSGQPRATTPSPGTAMSPRPPRWLRHCQDTSPHGGLCSSGPSREARRALRGQRGRAPTAQDLQSCHRLRDPAAGPPGRSPGEAREAAV